VEQIPIIKTSKFLATGADDEQCVALKDGVSHYGLAIILDERVEPGLPVKYREVVREAFRLPREIKEKYIQPPLEDGTQVYENGWRPPFTEKPRRRDEVIHLIPDGAKPREPPSADPKERIMYPFGKLRAQTDYPMIDHAEPMVIREVEGYRETSEAWGRTMYMVMMTIAQMLAVGFGEPRDLFSSMLEYGPLRLAPTGLDLSKWGPGTVAAGFHNDLSCFTMHGMSNWPGLWAWTRLFEKYAVRLPDERHLLLQVGRVLEHLTAGQVKRGYHEVVMPPQAPTVDWRVTTTSFYNIATDRWIEPVGGFAKLDSAEPYMRERIVCGRHMMNKILGKTAVRAA
jgi:isopenicillin N synthase-like dioxygenase